MSETPDHHAARSLQQDRELVADFIAESREHLARIEARMLEIERDNTDLEPLHGAFRGFHTIKGLAGFLEFPAIQRIAHEVETVLDMARTGRLAVTPEVVDVVLSTADHLGRWLGNLDSALHAGLSPESGEHPGLIERIRCVQENVGDNPVPVDVGLSTLARASEVEPSPPSAAVEPETPKTALKSTVARATVKVDTRKLDHLVEMVGEMVIAQSLIRHDPTLASLNLPRLSRSLAQLARITDDVQKTAMSMRMMPVGPLFQKMTRVVRDLSRKTGKEAELELFGEETELDRNIVEELADPLMHMLRNAMDHGVEAPEVRQARGKPPVGRLRLRASHHAGHILIEVGDDGGGLDRARILAKARERGIVGPAETPSDGDIDNLIFEPGFSTAREVTNVSGRGVGMDVVRRHVGRLRGRIDIESRPGAGTTFYLKLPLTLAIIEGLVVGVGTERYILPLFAVREMLRPSLQAVFSVQNHVEMALVRGRLLPVIPLDQVFGIRPRARNAAEGLLIVAESEGRPFCVVVDELIGKQEVVIKTLGPLFENVPGIAGGAILGDGRVGLILDLGSVFVTDGRQ
jgi:two-component system chemotaxis sensor kinase CheA